MANEYRGGVFVSCIGEEKSLLALPAADDALVAVLLRLAGLPTDDVLERVDTLAALLATYPECNATNYERKVSTTQAVNVDKTNNRLDLTLPALTYAAFGGATNNDIGKLVWCYRPTSASADSAIRPVLHYRCVMTTDGTTRQVNPNAAGSLSLRPVRS